jgi:hypothetical protein
MTESIKQKTGALSNNSDAIQLSALLGAAQTELSAIRTLVNELRTDHLATGTSYQPWLTEVDADLDLINDYLHYAGERDGVIGGNHTMGKGTDTSTKVRLSGTVRYRIGGVEYSATNIEAALATGEITGGKWGAWRLLMGKTGVLTTQRATANGTSGVMAFASGEDALLSLSQIAISADCVEVGYLTIDAAAGGFTPGADDPDAGNAQVDANNYYNCRVPRLDNGLTATPSVGLSEGTSDDEYAFGTINVRTNSLNVAEIAADVTIAFADADVITTSGKFGGELFVTDLAGTAIMSLASTGIAGGAQTVDLASAVAANTALDAVQAALPQIFTVIGRVVVEANKASFTFNTDDLAGTDGTATWTDEVAADYDRTKTSGAGVGVGSPAIPATVAAVVPAGVASSAISEGFSE